MTISESVKSKLYRYRWTLFIMMATAYFFVYFHRMTVGVVGEDIINEVGGTIGILSSVYFWTYTAMQIPSGLLADTLGPRKATFIFLSIATVGSLITFAGTEFWMIVLGKMLIAAGMAIIYIPLMKIISVWYGREDFPQLNGIVIAVGNVGAIAASAPLAILADAIGWREVFLLLGIVTMVLAVLCITLIRDHPHDKGSPSIEEIKFEEQGIPIVEDSNAKLPVVKGLLTIFSGGRKFWNMALAYFLIYGSIMVFQGTWMKTYFGHVYDFAFEVAWFITILGVAKIVSTLLIGRLTSKGYVKSKRKLMAFGTFCFAMTWFVIWAGAGLMDNYWFWFLISALFGFFAGFMTLSFSQVKEWYPLAISGTTVSAMNVFLFLGASVFTTIAGIIIGVEYTLVNFELLWALMLVAAVVAFILVLTSKEKKEGDSLVEIKGSLIETKESV